MKDTDTTETRGPSFEGCFSGNKERVGEEARKVNP